MLEVGKRDAKENQMVSTSVIAKPKPQAQVGEVVYVEDPSA